MAHLRTLPESYERNRGIVGGYGWFLGRFPSYAKFMDELATHLLELGFAVVEVDEPLELRGADDLDSSELQELFELLNLFPIQYRTLHLYAHDDA